MYLTLKERERWLPQLNFHGPCPCCGRSGASPSELPAGDLGISPGLLSHYENGIREPGLAFVVKACDYYHVSADFILGRTLSREGNMLTEQEILNAAEPGNILQGSVLGHAPEQAALRALWGCCSACWAS